MWLLLLFFFSLIYTRSFHFYRCLIFIDVIFLSGFQDHPEGFAGVVGDRLSYYWMAVVSVQFKLIIPGFMTFKTFLRTKKKLQELAKAQTRDLRFVK